MFNLIGMTLDGRYEILEVVGRGGMAEVYKAIDHRLNRNVAVKFLKEEYALDEDFKRRFHDEAQSVAMLSHPNIVAVYDVSRNGDLEYIVMELIDGITLKSYLEKRGPLSWKETTYFAMQIARALEHAHDRGIIHRDIKPQNIMLLRDGTVKVADFGIAHQMDQTNNISEAIGSVHYVAPEQARGSTIDNRADIYSLGVVMYEMLTGRLPFEGDSAVSVALQHMNSLPLMPSDYVSDIPKTLEQITMKAMAPRVSSRYASASLLLADLESFKNDPKIELSITIDDSAEEDEPESELTRRLTNTGQARDTSTQPQKGGKSGRGHLSTSFLFSLLAIAVFLVGAVFFVINVVNPFGSPENDLTIPNLLGYDFSEVIANEKYNVFEIRVGEEIYSDTTPSGVIISQDPVNGRSAKPGDAIVVTVSKGPKTYTMRNMVGMEYKAAEAALSRNNISSLEKFEYNSEIEKDIIISTDPGEGAVLNAGDSVVLIISLGAEKVFVRVPGLIGLNIDDALALLAQRNLNWGDIREVEGDQETGTVVYQSIPENTEIETGSIIDLNVCKKKEETTSTSETVPTTHDPSEPVTIELEIDLLEYSEPARIDIYVDDVLTHSETVSTGLETYTTSLTAGYGEHNVKVFQDHQMILNQIFEFR